jgi:hypothetical protein
MNPETSSKLRGTIIKVPDSGPGLLFANGRQMSFSLEGIWRSPMAPTVNMTVDLDLDGAGAIRAITVVDSQQLTKERLNQLGGVAQEQGKQAAKLAQQGVGALAARMGAVPLGAAVVLWVAWFFFPAAGIAGGIGASLSYTFWGLLGTDFSNPLAPLGAGSNHGLFAIIGLIAIVAPFAAPFLRTAWSHYLNAAPLAFILVAWIDIYLNENKAFSEIAKIAGANPFSFSWGIFILAIAALVLAAGVLKKPAA